VEIERGCEHFSVGEFQNYSWTHGCVETGGFHGNTSLQPLDLVKNWVFWGWSAFKLRRLLKNSVSTKFPHNSLKFLYWKGLTLRTGFDYKNAWVITKNDIFLKIKF